MNTFLFLHLNKRTCYQNSRYVAITKKFVIFFFHYISLNINKSDIIREFSICITLKYLFNIVINIQITESTLLKLIYIIQSEFWSVAYTGFFSRGLFFIKYRRLILLVKNQSSQRKWSQIKHSSTTSSSSFSLYFTSEYRTSINI